MGKVYFWKGAYASYLLADINDSTIYFIEDKNQVYKGHNPVGLNIIYVDEFPVANIIPFSIYKVRTTDECRIWDGNYWIEMSAPAYTAFEVYPTTADITAGTVDDVTGYSYAAAVPANMVHRFKLRTTTGLADVANSDVVIDWGDGTASTPADYYEADEADWESDREVTYIMRHTYNTPGRYVIKITGKDYFSIQHSATENCLCRVFDTDLPVASCLTNLSNFARGAHKILRVHVPTGYQWHAKHANCYGLFLNNRNLVSATGFGACFYDAVTVKEMFYDDRAMTVCDMILPPKVFNRDGHQRVYANCYLLAVDIATLLPPNGFTGAIVNPLDTFSNAAKLTGTPPASILWEDTGRIWLNKSKMLNSTSAAMKAQVPTSWGGTNADIVVPEAATKQYVDEAIEAIPEQSIVLTPSESTGNIVLDPACNLYVVSIDSDTAVTVDATALGEDAAAEFYVKLEVADDFSITFPDNWKWSGGDMPEIVAGDYYFKVLLDEGDLFAGEFGKRMPPSAITVTYVNGSTWSGYYYDDPDLEKFVKSLYITSPGEIGTIQFGSSATAVIEGGTVGEMWGGPMTVTIQDAEVGHIETGECEVTVNSGGRVESAYFAIQGDVTVNDGGYIGHLSSMVNNVTVNAGGYVENIYELHGTCECYGEIGFVEGGIVNARPGSQINYVSFGEGLNIYGGSSIGKVTSNCCGGTVNIYDGGVLPGEGLILFEGDTVHVYSGGVANNVCVSSGITLIVDAGGTANDVTDDGGTIQVAEGGIINYKEA